MGTPLKQETFWIRQKFEYRFPSLPHTALLSLLWEHGPHGDEAGKKGLIIVQTRGLFRRWSKGEKTST